MIFLKKKSVEYHFSALYMDKSLAIQLLLIVTLTNVISSCQNVCFKNFSNCNRVWWL